MVEEEFHGYTLERLLRSRMKMSSSLIKRLKTYSDGMLRNGEHIRSVDIVKKNDVIILNIFEENSCPESSIVKAKVIYEDLDVAVLDKPPYMPSHPSRNHQGDTLANAFAAAMEERGTPCPFRPINRLDRDTSGLTVTALNPYSAHWLSKSLEKRYYGIVQGRLDREGTVDSPISRLNERATIRICGAGGQNALTRWRTISSCDSFSLAEFKLETGRTHQIRAHMSYIGKPLAGDDMYGGDKSLIGRQALHCGKVSWINPIDNKRYEIESAFPEDMQRLIDFISTGSLRNGKSLEKQKDSPLDFS